MDRRTKKAAGRGSMVSRGGLSLCGNRNLRGSRHRFDGSISRYARHGGECLVGPRATKNGDLHDRSECEKHRIRWPEHERWRLRGFHVGSGLRRGTEFQTGRATRVVTLSLKARAAITMAGHKADAATWFDTSAGAWVTSSAYGTVPFVEEFAKKHPATEDYGKTWALSLPADSYLYDGKAIGVSTVTGWATSFPHPMRGKEGATAPDESFLEEWTVSPFADTALTRLAESAVDSLSLGKSTGTDYLGISYSSVDYVGH